jgi:inosine/xanthosine triphosphate pyrophosphatase family protein
MKTILLATHNQGKIKRYKQLFAGLEDLKLVTLAELGIDLKVDEPFSTPEENSAHKAREYGNLSQMPTIAVDDAVTTNFLPVSEQPGVMVRRTKDGQELTDQEMLDKWQKIFELYPHPDRQFIWNFGLSYYDPKTNELKTVTTVQINSVADTFSNIIDPGYPMSSFLVPQGLDKPHSELSLEDRLLVDKKRLNDFLVFVTTIVNE